MPCCSSYLYHVEWWQVAGQFFFVHLLQHPLLFPVIRKSESLQVYCTHVSSCINIVYQRLKRDQIDQMDTTLATTSHAPFRFLHMEVYIRPFHQNRGKFAMVHHDIQQLGYSKIRSKSRVYPSIFPIRSSSVRRNARPNLARLIQPFHHPVVGN